MNKLPIAMNLILIIQIVMKTVYNALEKENNSVLNAKKIIICLSHK
jgi:hypothetical protein